MNLHNSVKRFATESYTDPYSPLATAIKGRITVFNEVTNSGQSSRRRILELQPGVNIFSNNVIDRSGEKFIVGYGNNDLWRGEIIRVKYPVLPIGAVSKVASVYQILTAALPTRNVYGHPIFTKDVTLEKQQSDIYSNLSFYLPRTESVAKGQIIVHNSNNYYRVRNAPFVDSAGFLVADVGLLESPLQSLVFISVGVIDPVTDTVGAGAAQTLNGFIEEAYLYYDNTSERFAEIKPGDKVITIKPTIDPKVNDAINSYRIISIEIDSDSCSICHCRP